MQNSNCRALKMSSCEFRYLWGWASWKHEWCVPMSHCKSEVPRKAKTLSSNRSDRQQIVVTAVPLSIRISMTQPFVFSCLHISPHLFPGLGCFTSSATFPAHFPLWLPQMFRFISQALILNLEKWHQGSISPTSKGTAIPSGLFWHVKPNRPGRNAPHCYTCPSDASSASAQASRTLNFA